MGSEIEKSVIIERIKSFYGFQTNNQLAKFLGVAPNTISGWVKRNTIDYDLIFSKCIDMDINLLLRGSKEIHEDIKSENIKELFGVSDWEDEDLLDVVKTFNGKSTLYKYLLNKCNYTDDSTISEGLCSTICEIYDFSQNYSLYIGFDTLYEKFKNGSVSGTDIFDLFKKLVDRDKVFCNTVKAYKRELEAVANSAYRLSEKNN